MMVLKSVLVPRQLKASWHTGPQSGDSKKQAAATAAEKAPRQAPRRKGSDWMEGFDLKKSPPVWKAARASEARPSDAPDSP